MKRIISFTVIVVLLISCFSNIYIYANSSDYFFFESFEDTLDGWTIKKTSDNVKFISSSDYYSDGSKSMCLLDYSTTDSNHNYSDYIDVTSGTNFKFMVDAYIISGSAKAMLRYYTDKDVPISGADSKIAITGMTNVWYTHSVYSVVPDNAKYLTVWIYTDKSQVGEVYIDNIRVSENYDSSNEQMVIDPPIQVSAQNAQIVSPSGDSLTYKIYDEEHGDTLSDFSYAGYYAGKYQLPDTSKLAQFQTISPSENLSDDTSRIQQVINNANKEYKSSGKVQVITLKRGRYNINSSGLNVKSGVVLKGEGQGPNGTILYAYEAESHCVINIIGYSPKNISDENAYVLDSYIPSGSKELTIEEDKILKYSVGDLITIYHPNDDKWNIAMGMKGDNMTYTYPIGHEYAGQTNNTSWDAGEVDMKTERTITGISENKITLDFPLFVPYDTNYSKVYIYKTDDSERCENIGIENLRIESYYDGTLYDENHASSAIYFSYAKNCFVRDVSTKYMWYSSVNCQKGTKQITVQNCSSLTPISKIDGSRRYTFYTGKDTQQNLFIGCYSYDGRHDFSTSYQSTGPTVFADSVVDESNAESETHGTWSTGVLYDSIMQLGNASLGSVASINRGYYGSTLSQGWSGAGVVMWNCLSNTLIAHKPPLTYQNFLVGQWGYYDDQDAKNRKYGNISSAKSIYKTNDISVGSVDDSAFATQDGTSFVGDAYKESEFAPVEPRSLFKAQLAYRTTGSYKNAKPNAPAITYPRADTTLDSNTVFVRGLYQQEADKVTVYVDDVPYTATLSTYTFNLSVPLENGTHKIYVTQTIDGIEGNKSADRFVIVNEEGTWQDYLTSNSNTELTSVLVDDPRLRYDEIEQDANGAYIIDSKEKFEAIFSSTNTANQDLVTGGNTFKQTASFTLSSNYAPVQAQFKGIYDGGSNTISYADNFTLSADNFGLFYQLNGATIKNLSLDGTINAGSTIENIGGFAYTTVSSDETFDYFTDCVNSVDITSEYKTVGGFIARGEKGLKFTRCVNEGNITGTENIGGFQGFAGATYEQCANYGNIKATGSSAGGFIGALGKVSQLNKCANFGDISALRSSGGIVGIMASNSNLTVTESYNTGKITVTGTSNVEAGGIVGRGYYSKKDTNNIVTITNCYNAGTFSAYVAGSAVGVADVKNSLANNKNTTNITNFYDAINLDIGTIGAAVINDGNTAIYLSNAYTLKKDAAYGTAKVADDFTEDIFSANAWNDKKTEGSDYPYIQLGGNPYVYNPEIYASILSGSYVFTGTDTTGLENVEGIENVKSAYAVIAARFAYNSTLIENDKTYGVLVSKTTENPDVETYDRKFEGKRNLNGFYGILLYNLDLGTYYVRPYIEYNGTYWYGTADTFTIK